jgi:hypothetical protein
VNVDKYIIICLKKNTKTKRKNMKNDERMKNVKWLSRAEEECKMSLKS